MVDTLDQFRDQAAEYYETQPYKDRVGALYEVLDAFSDRLADFWVALDLEGVLINHKLRGNLAKRYPEAGGGRLRRPLANELLAWLSDRSQQVAIWTAATGEAPFLTPDDAFIRSSGLCIPDSVKIWSRYQYIWAIAASNNTEWANSVTKGGSPLQLPSGMNPVLAELIRQSVIKVPSVLGVDFLWDDRAVLHEYGSFVLGYPDEGKRLIPVPHFPMKTKKDLKNHHLDTGLLDAARTFSWRILEAQESS